MYYTHYIYIYICLQRERERDVLIHSAYIHYIVLYSISRDATGAGAPPLGAASVRCASLVWGSDYISPTIISQNTLSFFKKIQGT